MRVCLEELVQAYLFSLTSLHCPIESCCCESRRRECQRSKTAGTFFFTNPYLIQINNQYNTECNWITDHGKIQLIDVTSNGRVQCITHEANLRSHYQYMMQASWQRRRTTLARVRTLALKGIPRRVTSAGFLQLTSIGFLQVTSIGSSQSAGAGDFEIAIV